MKSKKNATSKVRHLWRCRVHHRDYIATMNARDTRIYMKDTTLLIPVPQPDDEKPSVDAALSRVRAHLRSNQRTLGRPTILELSHAGILDE